MSRRGGRPAGPRGAGPLRAHAPGAAPAVAARLEPALRRRLGVGNATGLGMAPFLVRHPVLMHNWFFARETALARVRALPTASPTANAGFTAALAAMIDNVGNWRTGDQGQQ